MLLSSVESQQLEEEIMSDQFKDCVRELLDNQTLWNKPSQKNKCQFFFELSREVVASIGIEGLQHICFGLALNRARSWSVANDGSRCAHRLLVDAAIKITKPEEMPYTPTTFVDDANRMTSGFYREEPALARIISNGLRACFMREGERPIRAMMCMSQYNECSQFTSRIIQGILRGWGLDGINQPRTYLNQISVTPQ